MELQNLGNNSAALGFNTLAVLKAAHLTQATANTAQTFTIPVEPGSIVRKVEGKLVTPFKDADDAAFNSTTIIVGDGGDTDRFMALQELNENGTEIRFPAGTGTVCRYTVADTIDITIGSMLGKSLANIDVGELHLYLDVVHLNRIGTPIG